MKRSREPQDAEPDSAEADAGLTPQPPAKIPGLGSAAEDGDGDGGDDGDTRAMMRCSLPPHRGIDFRSYGDYEAHCRKFHTNRCLECHKNFPSDHLLGVHIEEYHDPLVRVKRDRGEHTYSCFVEGCQRKCLTSEKRRMHMIDKHMYPKNFFFAVTQQGIDGRRSLLLESGHRRRRSSASAPTKESHGRTNVPTAAGAADNAGPPSPDTSQPEAKPGQKKAADEGMAELTGAMSALHFVPSSVRFGRGRAGFARR